MYEYRARIERCVDGDTVDASIDLGFGVWVDERCRLIGIDTPERGKPGFDEATEYLRGLLNAAKQDGLVACKTIKDNRGKFGRYLIEFFDQRGNSINEQMVKSGHAKRYGEVK